MNPGGEAADTLVKIYLSGVEMMIRLSGSALKNMLALSMALAKENKKVSGKINLTKMLRETRDLPTDSLDRPVAPDGDGRTVTLQDTQGREDAYPGLEANRAAELLSLILRFPERLRGHAANPEKLNYYRLFFTDGVSDALRRGDLDPERIPHQRELWDVLKERFLDFYLVRRCRSAVEIQDCPLKGYGELVPGRPMEEPKRPLPNDVYVAYLKTREEKQKTESAVSNQRKAYKALLREIVGEWQG